MTVVETPINAATAATTATSGLIVLGFDALSTSPLATWEVALDRLELDVVRMEHHLDRGRELRTDVWDAPLGHGPLPAVLRDRAVALHARQQVCLERVAISLGRTVRQHAVTEAVSNATPHAQPLYVDIAV